MNKHYGLQWTVWFIQAASPLSEGTGYRRYSIPLQAIQHN